MGALQGGVAGVAVLGRVVVADRAARLHRRGGDPIDDELAADDARGGGEGSFGRGAVADLMHEADVVGAIRPDLGRAGRERAFGRDDGRERLVLDLDQLGRVNRLVAALGDDKGDVIADPAHGIGDEGREARPVNRQAAGPLHTGRCREVAPAGGCPILPG